MTGVQTCALPIFADVSFQREGAALVVNVVENPIINRIAFEGNKRIDSETLTPEVTLRPRVVYTRTKVQNDVKRILDLYRRKGRFAATVEPKIIQLPQNRVDLVFEIEEGELTGVRRISFVGNKRYGAGRPSQDTYLLQQYLLHANLRYKDLLRVFVQGIHAQVDERQTPALNIDENF